MWFLVISVGCIFSFLHVFFDSLFLTLCLYIKQVFLISDFASLIFISVSVPCYAHLCLLIFILSFWLLSFILVMGIQYGFFYVYLYNLMTDLGK